MKLLTRRRFLQVLGATTFAGLAGAGYARALEPGWLASNVRRVPLGLGTPGTAPLRVLHLSDLHASREVSFEFLSQAIAAGLAMKPDVACVTGDFVTVASRINVRGYTPVLAALGAAVPTFGTLGNHDGGPFTRGFGGQQSVSVVGNMLRAAGITWLHNERAELTLRGRRVDVIGLGDLWNGDCRPEIAWRGYVPAPATTVVALSHNPDSKRFLLPHPWQLLLSGHTHGGQLWPAVLGRFTAPVEDKRYIAGLYRYEGRWLHVTRGVGNIHGVRVLCRPEVSLLEIS